MRQVTRDGTGGSRQLTKPATRPRRIPVNIAKLPESLTPS
jgi:hypothetical protein